MQIIPSKCAEHGQSVAAELPVLDSVLRAFNGHQKVRLQYLCIIVKYDYVVSYRRCTIMCIGWYSIWVFNSNDSIVWEICCSVLHNMYKVFYVIQCNVLFLSIVGLRARWARVRNCSCWVMWKRRIRQMWYFDIFFTWWNCFFFLVCVRAARGSPDVLHLLLYI